MDYIQKIKDLSLDKRIIFFREGHIPATLGNPEPILSKVDIVKFGNPSSLDVCQEACNVTAK